MVSGGMSCIKYLLFAFNLVFVIFGILLVYSGISTVVRIGDQRWTQLLEGAPRNAAIVLIVVGFAIFLLAFLGCCGAIKENYCMLTTFSAVILVILLIELIGAGLVIAFKGKVKGLAEKGMSELIRNYDMKNTTDSNNAVIDDIQKTLHCCGANDVNDWVNRTHSMDKIPWSCCNEEDRTSDHDYCKQEKIYKQGCVDALDDEVRSSLGLLGGIAIAVAVIQLIGIIFSCSLSRSIKKEYEVV